MSAASLEVLCFRVGERVFSVDIMGIREILRSHSITPVPHAPESVAGVLNLRGELVPVVDLHHALMQQQQSDWASDECKLVVVRAGGRTAGMLVDQVLEVVSVGADELNPVPGKDAPGGGNAVVAAFRRELDGEGMAVVMLLRLSTLLAETGINDAGGSG